MRHGGRLQLSVLRRSFLSLLLLAPKAQVQASYLVVLAHASRTSIDPAAKSRKAQQILFALHRPKVAVKTRCEILYGRFRTLR